MGGRQLETRKKDVGLNSSPLHGLQYLTEFHSWVSLFNSYRPSLPPSLPPSLLLFPIVDYTMTERMFRSIVALVTIQTAASSFSIHLDPLPSLATSKVPLAAPSGVADQPHELFPDYHFTCLVGKHWDLLNDICMTTILQYDLKNHQPTLLVPEALSSDQGHSATSQDAPLPVTITKHCSKAQRLHCGGKPLVNVRDLTCLVSLHTFPHLDQPCKETLKKWGLPQHVSKKGWKEMDPTVMKNCFSDMKKFCMVELKRSGPRMLRHKKKSDVPIIKYFCYDSRRSKVVPRPSTTGTSWASVNSLLKKLLHHKSAAGAAHADYLWFVDLAKKSDAESPEGKQGGRDVCDYYYCHPLGHKEGKWQHKPCK